MFLINIKFTKSKIAFVTLLSALVAAIHMHSCNEADFEPLFPFVISYDSPDNAVNMSALLTGPAGQDGFIRVMDGRFVNDAGPVRLNGTNLTGAANFPTTQQADRMAARLARFGINCVRLHYMDDFYGNFLEEKEQGLIADDPATKRRLDSVQLDRLDYLIAELKKRGIYVNINMHVARKWDERDGFVDEDSRPKFDKGLDNFLPEMIELQKEYAAQLLTHVNPYTGIAYRDEPCVAMVEINNENGLLRAYFRGDLDELPAVYATEFQQQWNDWLHRKYETTAALQQAWHFENSTAPEEQVPEGDFSDGSAFDAKKWSLEQGETTARMTVNDGVLKLEARENASDGFPKLFRQASIKKDDIYTLSFRIRKTSGETPTKIGIAVADGVNGWRSLGLLDYTDVNHDWQEVERTFVATESSDKAQIQITRSAGGTFEIDDVSLAGAHFEMDDRMQMELGAVPILKTGDFIAPTATQDFIRFLYDTEANYWNTMYDFLRNELKVKSVISGGQLGFTPPTIQAQLDFVDNHAYWRHPGPVNEHWRIKNDAMVNSMGAIRGLATARVDGVPYTISEYNHPFPNQYGAEGQPMLRAYGRLQGWDGVFQYTYAHRADVEPEMSTYFFGMAARTDVLAHMPACAAIFLRGDVSEAKEAVVAQVGTADYVDRLVSKKQVNMNFGRLGVDTRSVLLHKTGIRFSDTISGINLPAVDVSDEDKVLVSDNGELQWNTELPGAGYFTVNTANTKLFSGFPAGRTITMGDVELSVGETRLEWATISLLSKTASGFGADGKPTQILLAATGLAQNSGMDIVHMDDSFIKLADWGTAPVLVEGVPAKIALPADAGRIKCFALDEHGERKFEISGIKSVDGKAEMEIKPSYRTVWYEIVIE